MGPALVEPDHGALAGAAGRQAQAAMGPALVEPDHPVLAITRVMLAGPPQWGRLSSSRITWAARTGPRPGRSRNGAGARRAGSPGPRRSRPRRGDEAAMGPALVEPDHRLAAAGLEPAGLAAMGPALV